MAKNLKILIYVIISVIMLIIAIVGITFAFFSASATNSNVISGNTSESKNLSLEIERIDTATGNLIPMEGSLLSKAIAKNCVDDLGNTVCHLYEFKVTNGKSPIKINGNISFESDSTNIVYAVLEKNKEDVQDINSLSTTTITSGISYGTKSDLAESISYDIDAVKYYYVAVWLKEIGSAQEDIDASKSYTGTVSFNAVGGNGVTATFSSSNCFAKGTKITMSDGNVKNIEDIKYGDSVKTFNHVTGNYENQPVYIIYKGNYKSNAFTLHFDKEEDLSIVGVHDLFEKETMKYVKINNDNAEDYIGHHFYNTLTNDFITLASVTRDINNTEFYSIYTEYNHNSIANNMLSVPDDIDYYLNFYEFNNDLTVNQDILNKDIEKYGLYDTSTLKIYSDFELDVAKYLNIIIGKKLATLDEIIKLREDYYEK